MLSRPRFRPHYHVEVVPGEGVFLVSESKQSLLRGRAYELVTPLLDGRTADEVCDLLRDKAVPAEVYYVLNQLERKGYLCEEETTLPAGQAAFWSSLNIPPTTAANRLERNPIRIRAFGLETAAFADLARSLGIKVVDNADARVPEVVLTDSYLRDELRVCNQESISLGRSWLLVKPTGRQVWVGPLLHPGVTACWECLSYRLRSNLPIHTYLEAKNGQTGPIAQDRACTPATLQIAWGLAASALAAWLAQGKNPDLEGRIQTLDVPSWRLQTHTLVRLPFCPACGVSTKTSEVSEDFGSFGPFAAPVLRSRKKIFTSDGGHRVVPPEETLARFSHHVSPITGAIPMLERAVPADNGVLHVYVAGNNMAHSHRDLAHLRDNLRSMNAGKGTSDAQAKASGLCEGLERYSGVFRGDEPRGLARMVELGSAAIPLEDCLLFSERQYHDREKRNGSKSQFNFVPVPLDKKALVEWSPVWSLSRQEVRYLPTAFCYYAYPQADERTYCVACSNGSAAGNTLEEAILQGFLELVERDSVALWWYNRVRRPAVDLHSFDEPYLHRLQAFLQANKREFWVIDLTADLGIPVFASICRRTDGEERIIMGFGAHLDVKIALLRAVTEMNQMLSSPLLERAGKKNGDRSKNTNNSRQVADHSQMDPETAHWLETATMSNQPYLLPADGPPRTASSYSITWTDDVLEDVRACQASVEQAGLEMLVLDQTRAEIGLPVAKVIVPGLRHFWARFAPGRLYDVPVKLGWLPRPLAEEELNPIAMFL